MNIRNKLAKVLSFIRKTTDNFIHEHHLLQLNTSEERLCFPSTFIYSFILLLIIGIHILNLWQHYAPLRRKMFAESFV